MMDAIPLQVWRVQEGEHVAYYVDVNGRPGPMIVQGPLSMTPTKEQLATVQVAEHLGRIAVALNKIAEQMPGLDMHGRLTVTAEVIGGAGDVEAGV